MKTDVLIIGGGLAGLSLADHLQARGQDWLLAEAQDVFGGRIQSPMLAGARFDVGPAWFWPGQYRMEALMRRFGLQVFEQFSHGERLFQDSGGAVYRNRGYASMEGSLRVAGGLVQLVAALQGALPAERVMAGAAVTSLHWTGERILATSAKGQIDAKRVVLALPPRIAAETISFTPALPQGAVKAALAIPTWMAGQAKFVAVYDRPYWREAGFSGDAISQKGPLVEIHDASPPAEGPYALFGFVGWPPEIRAQHRAETVTHAILQLHDMFGAALSKPLAAEMIDWAHVPTVATVRDRTGPGGHPAFGLPPDLTRLWDGCLHFGSTETARGHGGYLEGALEASERLINEMEN
ncbi:MAG TPA: FAD-dependent oxidoreductase [Albidovulum sp.]|uniref:flavin monoamine oxidase family protein n=1 Tax=Albidovulum sp. TaxID=1872424 RepID=UPI002BBBB087|nr:FAD-dependent oxidoreductase [Albidovulum sp.]